MMARMSSRPKPGSAYTLDHILGLGYIVRDQNGKQLTVPSPFRLQADRKREELQRVFDKTAKRGPRACLCCGKEFASEGIHHRMCLPCRNRASQEETAPFSFGAVNAMGAEFDHVFSLGTAKISFYVSKPLTRQVALLADEIVLS